LNWRGGTALPRREQVKVEQVIMVRRSSPQGSAEKEYSQYCEYAGESGCILLLKVHEYLFL
jgi:hypothetical protein